MGRNLYKDKMGYSFSFMMHAELRNNLEITAIGVKLRNDSQKCWILGVYLRNKRGNNVPEINDG